MRNPAGTVAGPCKHCEGPQVKSCKLKMCIVQALGYHVEICIVGGTGAMVLRHDPKSTSAVMRCTLAGLLVWHPNLIVGVTGARMLEQNLKSKCCSTPDARLLALGYDTRVQ